MRFLSLNERLEKVLKQLLKRLILRIVIYYIIHFYQDVQYYDTAIFIIIYLFFFFLCGYLITVYF